MNKKHSCSGVLAYGVGLLVLALGTALMERADFGMSMVVAPAYLIYLKLSQVWSFFTFGMAEYLFQAVVLVLLSLVMGRFQRRYLFSFVTAVLYGFALDLMIWLVALVPGEGIALRIGCYLIGMVGCSTGVAFLFHTQLSPEAYELFVKELAGKFHLRIDRVKTVYDCTSCLFAVVMSFCFFDFGHFEGVKLGTVLCALLNGWLIGRISQGLEAVFDFQTGSAEGVSAS